jgi:dTDP-4-dehydrorhamnose reductase
MRIVVTGARGQLGVELARVLPALGSVIGLDLPEVDVAGAGCIEALAGVRPTWIVHAAAVTDVDGCQRDPARAMAVNAEGTRHVAEACRRSGAGLLYVSTDYVFDGQKSTPYTEADVPAPLSAYGRSKWEGERRVRTLAPRWIILRTAWLYSMHGKNFVKIILGKAAAGERLRVVDDQVGSPTYAADLADAVRLLLERNVTGLYHVTNAGACSWYAFTQEILRQAGFPPGRVEPMTTAELGRPAPRPVYSVLANTAWQAAGFPPLRPWPEALAAMLAGWRALPARERL